MQLSLRNKKIEISFLNDICIEKKRSKKMLVTFTVLLIWTKCVYEVDGWESCKRKKEKKITP